MKALSPLCKPEFWFRPGHYWRRLLSPKPVPRTASVVRLPWGLPITVNPADTIGRQVLAFGLFELPVCEAITRLVDAGDHVADVGANLGHMTSLLAIRSGTSGRVDSFEPHPEVRELLKANVANWQGKPGVAPIALHRVALSDVSGTAQLFDEGSDGDNCGLGSLLASPNGRRAFDIETVRLDQFLDRNASLGLMKVDVEGAEALVFRGAERLLREKRIRDIVLEDQSVFPSESATLLQRAGYTLLALGVEFLGPHLSPAEQGMARLRSWDSPNLIATIDPERALKRLAPRGWRSLHG